MQLPQPDRTGLVQVFVCANVALIIFELCISLEHSAFDFVIPRNLAQPLDVLISTFTAVDDVPDINPAVLRLVFIVTNPNLNPYLLIDTDAQ